MMSRLSMGELKKCLKNSKLPERQIRFRCGIQNTVFDVLQARAGWQEVVSEEDWDFFWCDREFSKDNYTGLYLHEHQRMLHFRNHHELTRKNLMVKNLKRLKRQVERDHGKAEGQFYDFFPTSFELPFKRNPGLVWIMKPAAKSQGKGIFLFRKLKDIIDWKKSENQLNNDSNKEAPETYVVQRYIANPYLIGGKKFDVRVYVLVTSIAPLKIWIYRNGFARFSNTRYSLDAISDSFIHLTNVAIQKTAPDYDPEKGCKWSCQDLRQYLYAKHGLEIVKDIFLQIDFTIIRSLQSVQKIIINDKHCFEALGYDILIDDQLKVWLIEINASPSFTATSKEDYDLKYGLLTDVFNIIDMENRYAIVLLYATAYHLANFLSQQLTGNEKRIGGFDLLWHDGPVHSDDANIISNGANSTHNSFLGCVNNRKTQLRHIYTQASSKKIS
ncbi:probable tubulin polyglutamylase TTLL9 isoform X13 [Octopus vulgaris]|uniref:Tubulin--tyrosine ligase-like protein 9 n=1 Tax=Octopus vulgaris TaxID=6645 RepID=A0AA36AFZ4_OCTVU|nr:probable tubulin polyglutamylase TTLL9 isoform X13 [Octopus vulgaris]